MIRPEHPFDIRPDLRKAASTKAESTKAVSVIRPNQLVRGEFGCAQNRRILFVFSQNFDIIHHRLSKIIVQLGKVVPNCTRYTSSQKIPTKSDGSS
jgi:hypothetical protein